ncbi:toxin ParE1/3/4 [Variovorax paradoxus]|uniref:Toxin ParE1/3/4 n=2 Tax=Variovorax TaxID=34072 RepID=A0AAE3Y1A8_VARPD|nr:MULTISPECIES: type II toxin-antitoxin system RelE/ParE family toxin [Variovorax]MDP9964416.1 toxin ParE1/3/4 [Variovorax paradoxus]MDR6427346.1 toxin ParE1/3/4 [Variovorax paradoxus]MDR6454507.1 toxin ParE1/3/4 [Variovorax paradoxus]
MKAKAVVPREQANRDIDEAIAYYLREDAAAAAMNFIDALEKAYDHISRNPGTGSASYAYELSLPGLRFWPLTRFPYLVFYFEQPDCIDVWRLLHGQRDIPAWMQT